MRIWLQLKGIGHGDQHGFPALLMEDISDPRGGRGDILAHITIMSGILLPVERESSL